MVRNPRRVFAVVAVGKIEAEGGGTRSDQFAQALR
jgi:hypothetical protein